MKVTKLPFVYDIAFIASSAYIAYSLRSKPAIEPIDWITIALCTIVIVTSAISLIRQLRRKLIKPKKID